MTGIHKHTLIHTFSDPVTSVAFSPDGTLLASGDVDGDVRLWAVDTGDLQDTLSGSLPIFGVSRIVRSIAFSPNGNIIAVGEESVLWLHEVHGTRRQVKQQAAVVRSIAFSPDGTALAIACQDQTIRLWDFWASDVPGLDVRIGTYHHTLRGYTDSVTSVAFSPDGLTLASGDSDTIRLWDAGTGEHKQTLKGHTDWVHSIAFSPDGLTLASGSWRENIRLWDAGTGEHKQTLKGHTDWVLSVSFSPDGTPLASGSKDKTVRLWDVQTGMPFRTLEGHTNSVLSVSFSPDGSTLASGSWDRTVRLWDVATGSLLQTLEGHTDVVWSVSFSPDGSTLASGSWDDTIRLWDVATGSLLQTLEGHRGAVRSVSFSPDSSTLASGSEDDTIRLWDVGTGVEIRTLGGHTAAVLSVSFSPDSRILASGSRDGTVLLWELTPPEPPQHTEDVNGDGSVNIQDLVLVAANLGQAGQNTADVNGDGVVDIRDLVKVAGALGNAAAAPSLNPQVLSTLTTADVKQWLSEAQQLNLTDAASQRGIQFLEQLLAALTPKETALLANFPNPFNPETWIPYHLAKDADVTLTIYAIDGQVVRTLALGHQAAGIYQARSRAAYWDGRNALGEPVASGVYFYTLTAGDFTATRKMLIRK